MQKHNCLKYIIRQNIKKNWTINIISDIIIDISIFVKEYVFMLNNSEIKEKLEEMIKSKKADNSTLETINNSEIEIKKIQKNLGLLNEDLEKIADEIEQLKLERSQIAIFKVKDIATKIKEISEQKKKFMMSQKKK